METALGLRCDASLDYRHHIGILQLCFEGADPCGQQTREFAHGKILPDAASGTVEKGKKVVICASVRITPASLPSLWYKVRGIRAPKLCTSIDSPRR